MPNTKGYFYSTTPAYKAQIITQKKGKKDCNRQKTRMIAVRLSHRNYMLVTRMIPYTTWLSKLEPPKKVDIKIYENIKGKI